MTVLSWPWGLNSYGQLGNGTSRDSHTPVPVRGLTGVTAISAGGYRTVALKNDGTVWAWGYNVGGELGDGTNTNRNSPVQVIGLRTGGIAISAGGSHTVALKNHGTVWAWGLNFSGQLGDGTTTDSYTPVQVKGW
jgi:alpha-tubulin suppressor-like RCC1 family protein